MTQARRWLILFLLMILAFFLIAPTPGPDFQTQARALTGTPTLQASVCRSDNLWW